MTHFTQNWMSYLDDSKKLTDLTIPGTHDTCTYTAGSLAQCQTMNLEIQFKNGIRFWDVRLKVKDGEMHTYHGITRLTLSFDDILRSGTILLQQFPLECIVMSISHEGNQDKEELYEKLWPVIKDRGSWYKEDRIPRLAEVRGKVVFMRRFRAPACGFPVGLNLYDDWPKNSTARWKSSANIHFTVQDKYSTYSSSNLGEKFARVKPVLDEAKTNGDRLYLNFTSGTIDSGGNIGLPPEKLADTTNRLLFDYLDQNRQARLGIIPMDFPESERGLIRRLIGCNFFPFHELIFQKPTVFAPETGGIWTMAGQSRPDLVFIKTAGTSSGNVEVQVASGQSAYQERIPEVVSAFKNETDGTWLVTDYYKTFPGTPMPFQHKPDLVYIKTRNTKSTRVEVHVASGISAYKTIVLHAVSTFNCEQNGIWMLADCSGLGGHPDLVYIKTRNTKSKKVEVHVASGISEYKKIVLDAVSAFDCEEDGIWTMADWDRDGIADLVFIKTSNTPSGYVEIHIASAKSKYKDRILECKTAFRCETDGTWLMRDFTGNYIQDLVFIKTANTPGNRVEVHVASGER